MYPGYGGGVVRSPYHPGYPYGRGRYPPPPPPPSRSDPKGSSLSEPRLDGGVLFSFRQLKLPSLSSGGSAASPTPPSNRRARLKPVSPPLVVVAGLTFLQDTPRQFSGLAPKGRPGEHPRRSCSSLAVSRWADEQVRPILVRHRCVLRSRPEGRTGELALPLSHWEGPRPSQTHPQSSAAKAASSTVCSRKLKLALRQSVATLKCRALQERRDSKLSFK